MKIFNIMILLIVLSLLSMQTAQAIDLRQERNPEEPVAASGDGSEGSDSPELENTYYASRAIKDYTYSFNGDGTSFAAMDKDGNPLSVQTMEIDLTINAYMPAGVVIADIKNPLDFTTTPGGTFIVRGKILNNPFPLPAPFQWVGETRLIPLGSHSSVSPEPLLEAEPH